MAKKRTAKKKSGKKTRSAKQKAATAKMLAANKRKKATKRGKTGRAKKALLRASGQTTKGGYPKIQLRRNAKKMDRVLRDNNMGSVTLKG